MKTAYTLLGAVVFAAALHAQAGKPASPAAAPAAKEVVVTATSANVKDSGTPVKIRIFRWSSDDERTPLIAALTAAPAGRGGGGRGAGRADGGAGRAGAEGGGSGAPAAGATPGAAAGGGPVTEAATPAPAPPAQAGSTAQAAAPAPAAAPAQAGAPAQPGAAPAAGGAAAARGGAAGRGGRGGRGGADAAPLTPIQAFTTALQKAPTVGFLWTTDVTGYSIKYAWRTMQPDGTERIVLATDRRLGAYSPAWTVKATDPPTDYEFTVLELRLDAKGGEGKASLTTKVAVDSETKQLSLENYASAPAILQSVKKSS